MKELTPRQRDYLEWLLLPDELKIPNTQTEWGKLHGISPNTLTNWKKIPEFDREYKDGIQGLAKSPERTKKLLDVLYARGVAGDIKSAQLYLQATDQMPKANQNITIKTENAKELTDSELEALIGQYASAEKKNRELRESDNKEIAKLEEIIKKGSK